MMQHKITLTTKVWRRNHSEYLYLETDERIEVEQADDEQGTPAVLHIGEAATIYFEADEIALEEAVNV